MNIIVVACGNTNGRAWAIGAPEGQEVAMINTVSGKSPDKPGLYQGAAALRAARSYQAKDGTPKTADKSWQVCWSTPAETPKQEASK